MPSRVVGKSLAGAAAVLRSGEPALFPTDTVYGVGVSVAHAPDPEALFLLKNRPAGKPVAWLIADPEDLDRYGSSVPNLARKAAHAFWPGQLTLIVKASSRVPLAFQSQQGTVGLRMPAHPETLALIREVGAPLATTSANFSGDPAPRSFAEVDAAFAAQVGAALGDCAAGGLGIPQGDASGIASTVLDCTCNPPKLIREGAIAFDRIINLEVDA